MMLAILIESALRSFLLGSIVWAGLRLFRVRNPQVHMASWLLVLIASLLMPLLMHWMTFTITVDPLQVSAPADLPPMKTLLPEPSYASPTSEPGIPDITRGESSIAINWYGLASVVYGLVCAALLLRLAVGAYLTWRLVRAAKPLTEPWAAKSDVRVSNSIGGPVTFASTILLPPECCEWDLPKRQAVLAHEGAHVANLDFYVLLLASLNRALFWFSPFAWWQLSRLAELAEILSDARALEIFDDRLSYAEILLDLARGVRQIPAGLEMARAFTIHARIERILSATIAPAKVGWQKRFYIAAAILPVVIASAATIAYETRPVSATTVAGGESIAGVAAQQRVSFYSLGQASVFAIFREGDDLFAQLTGQQKLLLSPEGGGRYLYRGTSDQISIAVNSEQPPAELTLSRNGRDVRATRIAEVSKRHDEASASLDSFVGWYELNPYRVLAITREGERLYVQETGQPKLSVTARGSDAFGNDDNLIIFLRDDRATITRVLLHEPTSGPRLAPRIAADKARVIEERFARRIAEVPDRFRAQTPFPGSKDEVLRAIADIQRGTPNYSRMTAPIAAKIRRQASELESVFKALGTVESAFFRGVSGGGYDVYGVKFAKGTAEFRVLLDPDGKIDDVIFRADGNERVGGIVACTSEGDLRAQADTTPIHVAFHNMTATNIQIYRLDSDGKRKLQGVVGENMSSSVLTTVDSPWVVADASGACLEIVLPGQRTRFNTIEEARPDGLSEHATSRRAAPLVGSEEMLRQYIEAVARGKPNYDRMTAEVAAQTRQQLAFYQGILTKLGGLNALSFAGVTSMGNDIYMTHFANGTAEWRIGLARDGAIGRVALGPQ
jgi:beta-lactamase regulating signal transducer with metallopeptidase domain